MKEYINVEEYAPKILDALKKGILLNTNGDKFNSMVLGWGELGTVWGFPTFTAYVREHRYSKAQLDKTKEFTISIPAEEPIQEITAVCAGRSGRDVNKADAARLTLEEPEANHTPGVREYPITLECKVLYAQRQDLSLLDEKVRDAMYPQNVNESDPRRNYGPHTAYIGQIVAAYIIKE